MLIVEDLKFYYNKEHKIYLYNLKVKRGEVVCIMGKSGSGKSTLLDLLAGFLEPLSGRATFEGKDFLSFSPKLRPISILFQSNNLFEYLSVEKNIAVGFDGSFKLTYDKRDKIKQMLKQMHLNSYEKRIVQTLSGGEQQRVALSRALVQDRAILLLDEPFSGLDTQIKEELLHLVKKITIKKRLCAILVTHDEQDAKLIADKIYRIDDGVLSKF